MKLTDFEAELKQMVEDFVLDYTNKRKKGKDNTMFRPENEWYSLYLDYLETQRGTQEAA